MYFRHVPGQLRRKPCDIIQAMIHSTAAYKLYSSNEDKLVISRVDQVEESKS